MRPALLELGICLLWALLLTLVTCGLGICGVWGWNGETGGNPLALFGLPMLFGWMGTKSIAIGIVAQAVVCLCLTYLVRHSLRPQAAAARGESAVAPRAYQTNPWIICLLVIVGVVVTFILVGF